MNERMTVIPSSSMALAPLFQEGGIYEGQVAEVQPWTVEQLAEVVSEYHGRRPDNHHSSGFYDSETIHVQMLAPGEPPIVEPPSAEEEKRYEPNVTRVHVTLGNDDTPRNAQLMKGMQERLLEKERVGRLGVVGSTIMAATIEALAVGMPTGLGIALASDPKASPELGIAYGAPWFVWLNTLVMPGVVRHFGRLRAINPKTKAYQREFVRPRELSELVTPVITFRNRED